VAYYAQHHGTFSGGLKIRQKSHLKPGHLHGKIYDVVVTPRDFVLWDMRLTHSGNYKKLRLANNIHLHPRFESFLPTVLFAPEERVRYSCFCAFGRSSETLDSYLANLQKRRKDYGPYLKKSLPEEQARAVLRSLDIQFVNPDPEIYGSEYELLNR